jgi:membrane associated rhomboid family serine protease
MGENADFNLKYALIPAEILSGKDVIIPDFFGESPHPVYLTLITSLFLHGGWFHLLGNMLFLYIFGDNLETALGSIKFFIFYLVCGILASLIDIYLTFLFDYNTYTLSLGASGAISGIIGGYILLFPKNKIYLLFIFRTIIPTPAIAWGAMWITTQLIGIASLFLGNNNGIGYGAHLGGVIAGVILVKILKKRTKITLAT